MNSPNAKLNPYRDIYEEYADNASFLWVLRNRQLTQPQVLAQNIADLDNRINANLQGLLLSPDDAWSLLEEASQFEQGGEAFAMAVIGFQSGDPGKIQRATEFGLLNPDTCRGLVSALAWLPGPIIHPWLKQFFTSKNLDHKYLAVAACSLRWEDPAQYLSQIISREDCRADSRLYARCLRSIGEFKRRDLAGELILALGHQDPDVFFWALWSSLLLGNLAVAEQLKP